MRSSDDRVTIVV